MPKTNYSDDEIEAILTEDGAVVPDDFRLIKSGDGFTVVRLNDGREFGHFVDDDLEDAMVRYLRSRGASTRDQ